MKTYRLILAVAVPLTVAVTAIPSAVGASRCDRLPPGPRKDRCLQQEDKRGGGGGGGAAPTTISGLTIAPKSFKVVAGTRPVTDDATKGAAVTFTLSANSVVVVRVVKKSSGRKVNGKCVKRTRANRTRPKCTRETPFGAFTVLGVAGSNTHRITGVVNGKALKPGKYTLYARPKGNLKSELTTTFTIKK